jgi:hypothetical protein
VCQEHEAEVLTLEIMPDHVHLLVECDPSLAFTGWCASSKAEVVGSCGKSFRHCAASYPPCGRIPIL